MAAATFNADGYTTKLPQRAFEARGTHLFVLEGSHEVATAEIDEADDIIQFFYPPSGYEVVDGYLASDDLDTNGSPALTLNVGDVDDEDGFLVASTVGQAGGIARFNGAYLVNGYTTTEGTPIKVQVGTAAATAAAGTLRLVLICR